MTTHRNSDVRLLRWPQQAAERAWCHERQVPRILLIEAGLQPPELVDVYEDWIRPPVPAEDLQIRVRALASRRRRFNHPEVDPHGSLLYKGQRLSISPTQVDLIACLVRNFGELVLRASLADCLPGAQTAVQRNVLDLHIGRLRRKLEPIGLSIRTVWGCGYALEAERVSRLDVEQRSAVG
jgi:DNA-binding winged helix-turn-helix (wHTH) protein